MMLIASACPEENPDLVSPPSFSESVYVRFINLSKSAEQALGFDDEAVSSYVTKYSMTSSFNPKNDSTFASIFQNSNKITEEDKLVFFIRDLNYIFVSTPNPLDFNKDTLIEFTNIGDITVSEVEASVKFANLYADTTVRYSIIEGCPGGDAITNGALTYMQYTPADAQRADDEFVFSITKLIDNEVEIVGTFKTKFDSFGEYLILLAGNEKDGLKIYVIDELDLEQTQLIEVEEVETQTAQIKLVNLTNNQDNLSINDEVLINANSNFQSNFVDLSACLSASSETFTNNNNSEVQISPVVNEKYIALSYESSGTFGNELMIIPPPILSRDRTGKPVIRCLNLGTDDIALNVSIGANSNYIDSASSDTLRGYSSGRQVASKLVSKQISNPVILNQGNLPILFFDSQEPANYLYSLVSEFKANRNYLIVSYSQNGQTFYTVIDETEEDSPIIQFEEATSIKLVNGDFTNTKHNVSLSNSMYSILNNAELVFGNTITTLINSGNAEIKFTNETANIMLEQGKRVLFVKTNEGYFDYQTFPQTPSLQDYQFRVANLSDKEIVSVNTISGIDTTNRINTIDKGQISEYIGVNSQGRIFVLFEDLLTNELFYSSPEVNVNRRKIYTFILVGNSTNGYNLITLQDF